jgi:uncharacterized peroxidase-related enzyme
MAFIELVPESDASADVAAMYAGVREAQGQVTNFARAFAHRPGVYAAWRELNAAIKGNMDLRRYELATLAAARRLRSSYCALAHGSVLANEVLGEEATRAAASGDGAAAGLDALDVAVMELADKVAADATSVTQADVDRLTALGLSDAEVLDVVAAAAARCFFSSALDALGVQPDARFRETVAPALREALTVGRPIAEA